MESFEDLRARARRSLQIAEHMITRTYPLVNDPKLILAVADDIYTAVMSSMTAILVRKNQDFSDDFSSRFAVFQKIAPDYGFTSEDMAFIKEINNIISEHEESPVEFARKDRFVICDNEYDCKSISLEDMKNYLFRARLFIEKAESALEK